ncbi:dihydroorotase [Luteitalea pratensis]|uniref:Dihydroorotase n=2 Tax=Luteitalea pratensis TaxID=1855912 RepID=A0A143PHC4_LUTPR|nr:dihydroorotase [Luteitalea pratensis]
MIQASQAREVLDAAGCVVTPGLIDMHVHVYDGVAPISIPPDANCIAKGVTTVLDGGSAGAHTYPGFEKYVIGPSETRVYALLNISVAGQSTFSSENPHGELLDLNLVNPRVAAGTIAKHRDRILGVKVRLTRNIAGDQDLEVLARACAAAREAGVPVMAHIGGSHSALKDILSKLQAGDVITHAFRAGEGGILDDRGVVRPEVREAMARGIRLDVGHGANGFGFATAERALAQGILPDVISSDLHAYNYRGPVFDLVTTLSKFLSLGLTLEQVVDRATRSPANVFAFPEGAGTLAEDTIADVAVLRLEEAPVTFVDSHAVERRAARRLRAVATLKAGQIYGAPAA